MFYHIHFINNRKSITNAHDYSIRRNHILRRRQRDLNSERSIHLSVVDRSNNASHHSKQQRKLQCNSNRWQQLQRQFSSHHGNSKCEPDPEHRSQRIDNVLRRRQCNLNSKFSQQLFVVTK